MDAVDLELQRLRQVGDAPLKDCSLLSDSFRRIPPHKVGIAHLILKPRFLLADPVGCGKTPQALASFAFLKEKDPNLRLVVMAEKSAIFQWRSSVLRFLNGITPTVVGYDLDTGSNYSRFARHRTYREGDADVYILSYHQMARDINALLAHIENFVVIWDEVQHLKSQAGKSLYPAAQRLSYKSRYVWGLSATPIMNRLEEIHAIMEAIRPGTFGSLESFSQKYIEKEWIGTRTAGYYKLKAYRNLPEFMKILRPFYLKRPAHEIDQHLPEVVTRDVILEMPAEQARIYDEIALGKRFPEGSIQKEEGQLRGILATLTYAQLASDGPETIGFSTSSSKIIELLRILSEEIFGEKVIIYSRFRRTVDYICSHLRDARIRHVRITGAEDAFERDKARRTFNDSPDVNVICINKAGGTSLDLQSAKVVLFFDLPWGWGEWEQVLGRARRIGSPHEKVLAILLINRGTIDEHVLRVLQRKENLVESTLGIDARTLEVSDIPLSYLYNEVRKGRI